MKAIFFRVIEAENKEAALRAAVRAPSTASSFEVHMQDLAVIPRTPFAYWIGNRIREVFKKLGRFESGQCTATRGASTCDDFRYVRLWTEAPASRRKPLEWVPFTKGGRFSRFYA